MTTSWAVIVGDPVAELGRRRLRGVSVFPDSKYGMI